MIFTFLCLLVTLCGGLFIVYRLSKTQDHHAFFVLLLLILMNTAQLLFSTIHSNKSPEKPSVDIHSILKEKQQQKEVLISQQKQKWIKLISEAIEKSNPEDSACSIAFNKTSISEEAIRQIMQENFHKLHYQVYGPNEYYILRSKDVSSSRVNKTTYYGNRGDKWNSYSHMIEIWW